MNPEHYDQNTESENAPMPAQERMDNAAREIQKLNGQIKGLQSERQRLREEVLQAAEELEFEIAKCRELV